MRSPVPTLGVVKVKRMRVRKPGSTMPSCTEQDAALKNRCWTNASRIFRGSTMRSGHPTVGSDTSLQGTGSCAPEGAAWIASRNASVIGT
jgi:hypothetical protein